MADSKAFMDWPEGPRMAVRHVIEWLGGDIAGYCSDSVQVRMPAPGESFRTLCEVLRAAGLDDGQAFYFPIGSENVPEGQRHFGPGTAAAPRGDRPSYTYSIIWTPKRGG